jgi:hypothetical protein
MHREQISSSPLIDQCLEIQDSPELVRLHEGQHFIYGYYRIRFGVFVRRHKVCYGLTSQRDCIAIAGQDASQQLWQLRLCFVRSNFNVHDQLLLLHSDQFIDWFKKSNAQSAL